MGTNSLMVVGQPKRFGGTSTQVARRAPASPMVMQHFTQLLGDLSQKVNAIAVNQERAIAAREDMEDMFEEAMARPVVSREVEVRRPEPSPPPPPQPQRNTQVNRSGLLDFFD